MAKDMLHNKDMAKDLCGKVVNTTCHIVNRAYSDQVQRRLPMNYGKEENQM